MKNVVRFKSTAMIIALISAFSFTACKSDEPSGPSNPSEDSKLINLSANFSGEVSDEVFNNYDLMVTIMLDGKPLVNDNEVVTPDFVYNFNLQGIEASSLSCQVIATAKNELSQVDPEAACKIAYNSNAKVSVTKNDKTTELVPTTNMGTKSYSLTFKGERLPEYVARYPQITIMDVTYEFQ